ncbi:hypothetical protein OA857_03540 [Alphaproteobacteria bacterium]|nr:hypothetical protein [Alphaproteobacteria bacterium]
MKLAIIFLLFPILAFGLTFKDGNYYAEGPWDDEEKEIIGIVFKLKN